MLALNASLACCAVILSPFIGTTICASTPMELLFFAAAAADFLAGEFGGAAVRGVGLDGVDVEGLGGDLVEGG